MAKANIYGIGKRGITHPVVIISREEYVDPLGSDEMYEAIYQQTWVCLNGQYTLIEREMGQKYWSLASMTEED